MNRKTFLINLNSVCDVCHEKAAKYSGVTQKESEKSRKICDFIREKRKTHGIPDEIPDIVPYCDINELVSHFTSDLVLEVIKSRDDIKTSEMYLSIIILAGIL